MKFFDKNLQNLNKYIYVLLTCIFSRISQTQGFFLKNQLNFVVLTSEFTSALDQPSTHPSSHHFGTRVKNESVRENKTGRRLYVQTTNLFLSLNNK
jgi:hypothetical protein